MNISHINMFCLPLFLSRQGRAAQGSSMIKTITRTSFPNISFPSHVRNIHNLIFIFIFSKHSNKFDSQPTDPKYITSPYSFFFSSPTDVSSSSTVKLFVRIPSLNGGGGSTLLIPFIEPCSMNSNGRGVKINLNRR